MHSTPWKYSEKGISIVEVLAVILIIGIALGSLLNLAVFSLKSSGATKEEIAAGILAQKTMEEVRSFRDGTSWGSDGLGVLAAGTAYHPIEEPTATSTRWALLDGEEVLGRYTRKVVPENVSRDPVTKNIEAIYNVANNDTETKKIVVTISWGNKTLALTAYLTNWKQ
ncbi:MAG: hypothetical protein A2667_02155 [Candidatus Wildermuthbacteria bacterium RIFCSPHIGHO2_01_FULL_47_27]|uniref:Type IV pilus modification protein PilV n=2 Tax=Candidatus Wildermuthiibacteriota TaxID=1817923 RepID=A0A1G2RRA3_9BACT|nr:MAG: hypothetical protein UY15_C0007G0012 [Parcubacteria group bacterium GW2011_GWA2_47_9]OHA64322.1 MAG: hypothetical protein A2667_02155 [Candidatus Wildermuthbacteria bacterium RIFCSPHIGHO2_01_FULL_47_27]OHA68962.1 MAG: hypothetical protein A3D59_00790 [Candidatus Wildermuthbacteria bacterium RIFCSPHIGHO2_02_FULL_47_17]OHA75405.1 MAG: hypothetical protein A3A32_00680 [Candidatus Wildermuthbacteria bacterium RIFCSPLOWO2_01_FULL_48_35]OHA75955.1 MAG: hypothetical protein A3I38_04125 [Candid